VRRRGPALHRLRRLRRRATMAHLVHEGPPRCVGRRSGRGTNMNKSWLAVAALSLLLGACATEGTRASSNSDTFKAMGNSQQWYCKQFGCGCTLDGQPVTCSLVYACLRSGNCERAAQ
jgi:hypothetical protein